jgi:hypothetical protein
MSISMTVRDLGPATAKKLAAMLRKESGNGTHALVGPALVYQGEQLSLMVIVGSPGRPGRIIAIDLGRYEADPKDDALCAAADTVMWLREPGGITKREGDACRLDLIRELRRSFRHVEACDDGLALAEANARLFPSAKAKRLLAGIRAEQALGA